MIFIVSGEGSTDIGSYASGASELHYGSFRPGPMCIMIDQIIEEVIGYSLIETDALEFRSEQQVNQLTKELRSFLSIPGKKRGEETGYFFKNAFALGGYAKKFGADAKSPVGVVLFRDADGTRALAGQLYEIKLRSIQFGFDASDFEFGVPMVPKPKSEAWLLCALKTPHYRHCEALEESLSGNDNSPNSAKRQLAEILTGLGKSASNLPEMVQAGQIAVQQISMPSFHTFKRRLIDVASRLYAS